MRKIQAVGKGIGALEEMRQQCLEPDVITYNAPISICFNAKQSPKVLEIIQEMQQKDLEPDEITYSAAISACEKAFELLGEMRLRCLEPNVITYYAANSACDFSNQSQKVLSSSRRCSRKTWSQS